MKTLIAALFASFLFPVACWSQQSDVAVPNTAGDLRQLCKSYELLTLESDLKKDIAWKEVQAGSACLNFVMGVVHTVIVMDVGYYPEVKLELADAQKKIAYREIISTVDKYIDSHPEQLPQSAPGAILAALIDAGILAPKHWEAKKTK